MNLRLANPPIEITCTYIITLCHQFFFNSLKIRGSSTTPTDLSTVNSGGLRPPTLAPLIVTVIRKLRIAYNNSLRRLLGIPKCNCASEMFVQLNFKAYGELLRECVFCFINRMILSDNSILASICDSSVPFYSKIWI